MEVFDDRKWGKKQPVNKADNELVIINNPFGIYDTPLLHLTVAKLTNT